MNDAALAEERIREHYEDPYHRGACSAATHGHEEINPACGDRVRVELSIAADGLVREACFDGDGCCISQAAASMLIEHVEGRTITELQAFDAVAMLKLFGARLTTQKQRCCLLSWRALQTAIAAPLGR